MTEPSPAVEPPIDKDLCFIIGPVGEPDTDTRRLADQLKRHVIEPAAQANGLSNVVRADEVASSGVITEEIVDHLIKAAIVVADLSGPNANAFYELAIRHVARRPFVHLYPRGSRLPFDTAGTRAIQFDPNDWDSATNARDQLTKAIGAELGKSAEDVETPFTIAIERLQLWASSENPATAEMATVLRQLTRQVRSLDARISSLDWQASARAPVYRTSAATVFAAPPTGGTTQGVAGTTDIQELIDAQTFEVLAVHKLDPATHETLYYTVGGLAIANTLTSLQATDIVTLQSR